MESSDRAASHGSVQAQEETQEQQTALAGLPETELLFSPSCVLPGMASHGASVSGSEGFGT